jgi:hypothetical protein
MLTEDFISKLSDYKPMSIEISLHTIDPVTWSKILNLPIEKHEIVTESFVNLRKRDFKVKGSIVPLVKLFGYGGLESTIDWMSPLVNLIVIWPPGYTKYTTSETKKLLDVDYQKIATWLWKMRRRYSDVEIQFHTDPTIPLNFYPYEIMLDSFRSKFKKTVWFFSEAAFDRASAILENFQYYVGNQHVPFLVKNFTYGGNIVCSGLLMVNDFRIAMKKAIEEYGEFDLAIIPKRRSIDKFGNDLMNDSYRDLYEEFQFKIWEA